MDDRRDRRGDPLRSPTGGDKPRPYDETGGEDKSRPHETGDGDKPRPYDEEERAIVRREEGRPDPEELMRRYGLHDHERDSSSLIPTSLASPGSPFAEPTGDEEDATTHGRGRLRGYLAAAAGSGKTYALLNEGHRRKK